MKMLLHRGLIIAAAGLMLLAPACKQQTKEVLPPPVVTEPPPKIAPEKYRMALIAGGDGQTAIEDHRGKIVLVNFFAAGSPECRDEIAALNTMHRELLGRPFVLLGVAMDLKPPIYISADLRDAPPAFPYAWGDKRARDVFADVTALPTKWLIDHDGAIVKRYEGPASLALIRADIDALLK